MSGQDDGGKKRIAIIAVCSFLLVAMVIAVTVGVSINDNSDEDANNGNKNAQITASTKAIKSICAPTDFKKTCEEQLKAEAGNSSDVQELVQAAFKATMKFASKAANKSITLKQLEKEPRAKKALDICKQLMNYSMNELKKSFDQIDNFDFMNFDQMLSDLKVWLSATITNQQTCLEGFNNTKSDAGEKMKKALNITMQLSRNGLVIASEMGEVIKQLQLQGFGRRRLLQDEQQQQQQQQHNPFQAAVLGHTGFENILQPGLFRRLMADSPAAAKPDLTVAKDGSGDVATVKEAMGRIPLNSAKPFVIYIKEGVYVENLEFTYQMTNVVLIGDGMEKTRITGRLNNAEGTPTFRTATVAVNGDNFVAKNIGFENSAGAAGFQAVALLVISDYSVFYNCSMDGYQDTLYVHSKRQFYRECTITGTIDFVFGDSSSIFQNCKFLVRQPLKGQQCIVTAQGRTDVHQPTALVIQNCTFAAAPELVGDIPTFLGRPWGNFSRTIIMESFLDSLIKPEGWAIWDGPWGLDSCYYAEYRNNGPGSGTKGRVTWKGIKKINHATAEGYTLEKFIQGSLDWIKPRDVPFTAGFVTGPKFKASTDSANPQ